MKARASIIVVAIGATSLSSPASADLMVSNLGQDSDGSIGVSNAGGVSFAVYASKFTTGADSSVVTEATATMNYSAPFGLGTAGYQAYIYTGSGATPDSLVAVFDNLPTLSSGAGVANVTFESDLGIALDADTDYWFAIRALAGTSLAWMSTTSDGESSTQGWTIDNSAVASSLNSGSAWSDRSDFYNGYVPKYSLEGNVVPSPGALAMFGLAGLATARRRRA